MKTIKIVLTEIDDSGNEKMVLSKNIVLIYDFENLEGQELNNLVGNHLINLPKIEEIEGKILTWWSNIE